MTAVELIALILTSVFGSTLLAEIVRSYVNRNKTAAETYKSEMEADRISIEQDHLIVQMYDKLLDDMREDMKRMKAEIDELRKKETAYIENQNIWLARNSELLKRIEQMEIVNRNQSTEIERLQKEADILKAEAKQLRKQLNLQ